MIQGPGQPIRGPIQRYFGLSCIRRLYFLRKPTDFYDVRTECRGLNNSCSFITVPLISHKLPAISLSIDTQSLPSRSPMAPLSSEAVMSNFFLASEA